MVSVEENDEDWIVDEEQDEKEAWEELHKLEVEVDGRSATLQLALSRLFFGGMPTSLGHAHWELHVSLEGLVKPPGIPVVDLAHHLWVTQIFLDIVVGAGIFIPLISSVMFILDQLQHSVDELVCL